MLLTFIGGFKVRLSWTIAQALTQIHIRKHHFFGVPNFIEKSRTRHTWECVVDNRERERERKYGSKNEGVWRKWDSWNGAKASPARWLGNWPWWIHSWPWGPGGSWCRPRPESRPLIPWPASALPQNACRTRSPRSSRSPPRGCRSRPWWGSSRPAQIPTAGQRRRPRRGRGEGDSGVSFWIKRWILNLCRKGWGWLLLLFIALEKRG